MGAWVCVDVVACIHTQNKSETHTHTHTHDPLPLNPHPSTQNDGILLVYLAALPVVAAGWGPRLALMASLQELQVLTIGQHVDHANPLTVSLEIDPTFVAVGPEHVAAGINNQVWVYKTPPLGMGTAGRGGGGGGMVGGVVGTAGLVGTAGVVGIQSMGRRMFLGVVQQLVLNATYVYLYWERWLVGWVYLHMWDCICIRNYKHINHYKHTYHYKHIRDHKHIHDYNNIHTGTWRRS